MKSSIKYLKNKTKLANKRNKKSTNKKGHKKKYKNSKNTKKKIKGGCISPTPPNPTPSSYYPAPNNTLPKGPCKLPHFRPYLLNQKGI